MKDHSKVIILILLSLLNIFISVDIDRVVITDISEDKLNNVLKEDNKLFIFAYSNSQQQEQLFTNLINEIGENIKASSGINKIPIYFINIINFESINFIIGDLNESNFNLCFYSNKQIMNYYSSSYSFDDISKWIFDKYTSEEKQIIFSSIKNQIELKSKEIIDKPEEKEEESQEKVKQSQINIIKGGVVGLSNKVNDLENQINDYKIRLQKSKLDYEKISSEISPMRIFGFCLVIIVLVAMVIVYKRINKRKRSISII